MYEQFALLFALILTGYICRKRKIIDEGMNRGMNKFIITVAYPCLILNRMGNLEMPQGAFFNFIVVTAASLLIFFLLGGYAFLYVKARKYDSEDAPVAEFAILAPNNGFIGFPVAYTFFGDLGLLYMIACNLSLNIVFFSYGIKLMKRGRELPNKSFITKVIELAALLINPKITAAFLGLLLCNFQIELPELVNSYLSMTGSIATPMAMVFIGSTLAGCTVMSALKNRFVMEAALGKLIAAPIITYLAICMLPLEPLVKAILILCNAIPAATTVPIFSEQYDRNKDMASEILLITTGASMITLPIAIGLLKMIFF